MRAAVLTVASLSLACAASCASKENASAEGITLVQARGVVDAEEGPTIALRVGKPAPALPDGPVVRLAIERKVPWGKVNALLKKIEAAGKRPVLLAGDRWRLKAFVLSDELETDQSIAVTATSDFKVCVAPPGSPEAKCVQAYTKDRVDRANTRRLVREAVEAYRIHDIDVEIQPNLNWFDAVRAIDGSRTCCFGDVVRVKVNR